MKRNLKALINSLADTTNLMSTWMTDAAQVHALVESLRPVKTDKPLIRLGPKGDGGYLVPNDLAGLTACFSPGVSQESGFELQCAERGMDVFLADASVEGAACENPRFHFQKKFLGAINQDPYMTLDRWVAEAIRNQAGDLILQMDIEGYEYETLLATSDALMQRFRIIVMEFHHLDLLFSAPYFSFAARTFEKLLITHRPVHLHPNNINGVETKCGLEIPRLMEMTFLRRDRGADLGFADQFPHPLDAPCSDKPEIPLPECWRGTR